MSLFRTCLLLRAPFSIATLATRIRSFVIDDHPPRIFARSFLNFLQKFLPIDTSLRLRIFAQKADMYTRLLFRFFLFFFFFFRPRNNYSDFRGNFFAVWKYRVCLTEHVFLDGSIFKKLIRFHCLYRR